MADEAAEKVNVASRVNVARAVNAGSRGAAHAAMATQKVRIVQRDGETVVNEVTEERKEVSS